MQEAEIADHFRKGQRGTMLVADASHRRIGVSSHGREKKQRCLRFGESEERVKRC
jgi:hypothetical protein